MCCMPSRQSSQHVRRGGLFRRQPPPHSRRQGVGRRSHTYARHVGERALSNARQHPAGGSHTSHLSAEARVATEHQAVCVLPHLVNKPWKKLRVVARSITHESTDEDLHAVRIMAKRCRYCADTAAILCGSDAARLAQASKCAGSPGQLPRHRHHRTVAAPSSANNTRCRTNGGPAHRRAEE